jgi:hypothetical protein
VFTFPTGHLVSSRQPFHNRAPSSRIRLDANAIIDGGSNPLLAAKVTFRRLHRNVPQEELNLLQLASRCVAEASTGPSQIVRRQFRHSNASGGFLDNVPNRLHSHAISPCPSNFVDPAEQRSAINCGCGEPNVEFGSHPIRNWNRSNVASLADRINNGPMLFALLEVIQSQRHDFMPPQAAREQQCE